MRKKNDDFSSQDLSRLLNSPQAMALAAMLQSADPSALSQAAAAANSGDLAGAKDLLSPLLQDPKIRALLNQIGGNHG